MVTLLVHRQEISFFWGGVGGGGDSNDVFVQLMKVKLLFSLQILLKCFSDAVKPSLL